MTPLALLSQIPLSGILGLCGIGCIFICLTAYVGIRAAREQRAGMGG